MTQSDTNVALHNFELSSQEFLGDALAGMRQSQKTVPAKYFYDQRGCDLFDQICELEEYYPTRTELSVIRQNAADIAGCIGPDAMLIEYGSGSSVKTRLVLDALENPAAYAPVEIARDHLMQTAESLDAAYPEVEILPVCADFTGYFELPEARCSPARKIAYFPGSTIGNLETEEACTLLKNMAFVAGDDGGLVLGFDLQKDTSVIESAYNDTAGVTAAFNLNLLHRMNAELDADFDIAKFDHKAFYNKEMHRIEMHVVSLENQQFSIGGETFRMARGETILTEYSHKYSLEGMTSMAADCGMKLEKSWTDPQHYFAVAYFSVL